MAQGVKNYCLDSKKKVKFEMNLTLRVCGGAWFITRELSIRTQSC